MHRAGDPAGRAADQRTRWETRESESARVELSAANRSEITESADETQRRTVARERGGRTVVKRVAVGLTCPAATTWSFGVLIWPLTKEGRAAPEGCEPAPPARAVANGSRPREGAKCVMSCRKSSSHGDSTRFFLRGPPSFAISLRSP